MIDDTLDRYIEYAIANSFRSLEVLEVAAPVWSVTCGFVRRFCDTLRTLAPGP